MSNADLISRSIHQADRRFSDLSRGRQCAFISFQLFYVQTPAVFCSGQVHTYGTICRLQLEFAGKICRSNLHVKFVG